MTKHLRTVLFVSGTRTRRQALAKTPRRQALASSVPRQQAPMDHESDGETAEMFGPDGCRERSEEGKRGKDRENDEGACVGRRGMGKEVTIPHKCPDNASCKRDMAVP